MTSIKQATRASISFSAKLVLGAAGADVRAQTAQAPAAAENSGTLQRADADMRRVIEKLVQLGANPLGTQSVEETRRGPAPADAVKAILRDQGKDPAVLMAGMGVKKQNRLTRPPTRRSQSVSIRPRARPGSRCR